MAKFGGQVAPSTYSAKFVWTILHPAHPPRTSLLKFVFSKMAAKFDNIFTIDLTLTTYCQIDGEDFVNFCGLLRIYELYNDLAKVLKI